MSVVVRCPECRVAARVGSPVLGVPVRCPGCDEYFVAVEEAELVVPGPGWVGPLPPRPPEAGFRRGPLAPPEAGEDDDFEPAGGGGEPGARPAPEPDHDPYRDAPGGLPASVLIGLALLPFLIPILWLMAAAVAPRQPALTLAAPLALAVSASVLCLAVISTIDWTPGARIRGVLLLVGLSYVTGFGLYFLDRDVVDRVRRFLGIDAATWTEFSPPGAGYSVKVPSRAVEYRGPPPLDPKLAPLACHQAIQKGVVGQGQYTLVFGSTPKPRPNAKATGPVLGSDAWFDKAVEDVVSRCQPVGRLEGPPEQAPYRVAQFPGRRFVVALGDTSVRVVWLVVVKDRAYYVAVEGPGLDSDEDLVKDFFKSLDVADAVK